MKAFRRRFWRRWYVFVYEGVITNPCCLGFSKTIFRGKLISREEIRWLHHLSGKINVVRRQSPNVFETN